MALFLILQKIEPFTAGFSFEPFTASFRSRWLFFSYSRTSTILVIFVPKKLLFHLIPFIYGTSENRTFRPQNGFFFSIYALMEQYCFRRFSHTNTRRQTSPPATATVSVDSQREAEIYRNTTTLQDAPGRFLCAMCAKLGEILKSCTS